MMVDNAMHEHRLPQKKRPEAKCFRSFGYLVWGADYSHSIVAFGFGDMS